MAAMKAWSTSNWNGRTPSNMENNPKTKSTSCNKAATAPRENCHLRKRPKMYKKTTIKENMML